VKYELNLYSIDFVWAFGLGNAYVLHDQAKINPNVEYEGLTAFPKNGSTSSAVGAVLFL